MKGDQLNTVELADSIEACYTGGVVQWSADGSTFFSACGNYIKTMNVDDGKQSYTIGSEDEDGLRVSAFVLSQDDEASIVVAYTNGLLRNYRLPVSPSTSPDILRQWKSTHKAPVLVMRFENCLLATGSADFYVK
ncbi:unnamed protein product, partial [Gongylonema pulchrum]|uniref:ANAPC4_WD40 domain-containing protein n=1 Tax=Gongylonema pulchrum TaxID=637853 RepID=A0A183D937_9BILA